MRKRSIWVKISDFLPCVTLKFDRWPWKTIGHLFYVTLSFVHHYKAFGEFKLGLQSGNTQFGLKKKRIFFVPFDPEIWQIILKNNRAPLLCYFKLCASFCSHMWIQTEVTVQIYPIWVKIDPFLCHVTLKQMTLKKNRAPLLHYVKLCASLQSDWSIQTGVTVRKPSIWAKINVFVPCDLEIWWMTLKNNRAPLLGYFKLWASFHSHQQIQSRVTVWKSPIWVKIDDFFCPVWLSGFSQKSQKKVPWLFHGNIQISRNKVAKTNCFNISSCSSYINLQNQLQIYVWIYMYIQDLIKENQLFNWCYWQLNWKLL